MLCLLALCGCERPTNPQNQSAQKEIRGPSPEDLAKLAEARKRWLAEVQKRRAGERSPEAIEAARTTAIDLARNARTLDNILPNELRIQRHLETLKGDLRITGWQASFFPDENWALLVRYLFYLNGELYGWDFEVNLRAGVVRPVNGDPVLENKYYNTSGSGLRRRPPKLP